MRLNNKICRKIFAFTIKSPLAPILLIVIMLIPLAVIAYTSSVNVYIRSQGTLYYDRNFSGELYVLASIDSGFQKLIHKNGNVTWYVQSSGKRYKGIIASVENKPSGDVTRIKVKLMKLDVKKEFGVNCDSYSGLTEHKYQVLIEILWKKKKIIEKIFE